MRRLYGNGPLHLVGHVLLLAAAAWALAHAFQTRFAPLPVNLALWFFGGALIHDLVLLPAYAVADRVTHGAVGRLHQPAGPAHRRVPLINHIRAPALVAGVLLLVYAPRILDREPRNVINAAGRPTPDLLTRWLVITAVLFALSAVVYAVRVLRAEHLDAPAAGDHDQVADRVDGD